MLPQRLTKTILTPLARLATEFSQWASAHSQDRDNGIMIVHCMDARLNLRDILRAYLVTPNAYTPAGAIVTTENSEVGERLNVARGVFAMKDILITGHQNCAAMGKLSKVLLGQADYPYYQNFLVSGEGFPKIDLSDYIERGRLVAPTLTDNLAVLTALHSARNVLNYDVHERDVVESIATLVELGLIRIHIGYTALEHVTDRKWTETHYLLNREGTDLVRTNNLAQSIIAQRSERTTLQDFQSRLENAQTSFSSRLALAVSPIESLRA